jgi:hypothetical protein
MYIWYRTGTEQRCNATVRLGARAGRELPSEVVAALELLDIARGCCAYEPAERPPIAEVVAALELAAEGTPRRQTPAWERSVQHG